MTSLKSISAAPARPAAPSASSGPLRVAFALPGLHRVVRGAEVAFESIAQELAQLPGFEVTLFGSGQPRPETAYTFLHAACRPREKFRRWPRLPVFRHECAYEEWSFARHLRRVYDPAKFDVTIACSYPFMNWLLRSRRSHGRRPAHVYVTQNGDWPLVARRREYRFFNCDGLVCTNPEYYDRHQNRWPSVLIPNGVDPDRFSPGPSVRARWGLPEDRPVVLIVSALIPSKRVMEGLASVAQVPNIFLAVAGQGPQEDAIDQRGRALLADRFKRLTLPREEMPDLYRSADVLLHMSKDEPFGNIYVEAMSAGLPIVAHDRTVTRWITENQAILVNTDSQEAVAAGIRKALAIRTPEAIRARHDLACRRFAWSTLAGQYADFLRNVAARYHARAAPAAGAS